MKRSDIILILLSNKKNPIVGTTRLQKLLFLVEKEKDLEPSNESFDFIPYKFGPASKTLYNDIEFLVNMGLIEKSNEKIKMQNKNLNDIEGFSANDFLSSTALNSNKNDENKELLDDDDNIVYRITEDGICYLNDNKLLENEDSLKINSIKDKYSRQPLHALLQYVYRNYPDFITESIIKDEVL